MLELATLAANFLAFALLHGAEPWRRPERWRRLAPLWSRVSRWSALLLVLFSVALWARIEGLIAALLVVLTMFSAAATLFLLVVPVAPRLIWGTALVCAVGVPGLAWWGGLGG